MRVHVIFQSVEESLRGEGEEVTRKRTLLHSAQLKMTMSIPSLRLRQEDDVARDIVGGVRPGVVCEITEAVQERDPQWRPIRDARRSTAKSNSPVSEAGRVPLCGVTRTVGISVTVLAYVCYMKCMMMWTRHLQLRR